MNDVTDPETLPPAGDRLEPEPDRPEEHPILSGLAAMIGVTVLVGGLLGIGALVAARVTGVDDGNAVGGGSSANETLYLPQHTGLEESSGPYITLAPGDSSGPGRVPHTRKPEPSQPAHVISLTAGQTAVGQMEPIDLTGTYPGGAGSILEVQQFKDGSWTDFPVTISVNDDSFSTFIQASALGQNRFRVVDTDTGLTSNPITVQIG